MTRKDFLKKTILGFFGAFAITKLPRGEEQYYSSWSHNTQSIDDVYAQVKFETRKTKTIADDWTINRGGDIRYVGPDDGPKYTVLELRRWLLDETQGLS